MKLGEEIIFFFQNQGFATVTSVDAKGFPHASCKGIVKIEPDGKVYILDLYLAKTRENLKQNPRVAVTAIDEHKFKGYSLKGEAKIVPADKLGSDILEAWEARVTGRATQRLLKNIKEGKGHPRHPEAMLPKPKYMLEVKVEEVVDLTPQHLK